METSGKYEAQGKSFEGRVSNIVEYENVRAVYELESRLVCLRGSSGCGGLTVLGGGYVSPGVFASQLKKRCFRYGEFIAGVSASLRISIGHLRNARIDSDMCGQIEVAKTELDDNIPDQDVPSSVPKRARDNCPSSSIRTMIRLKT
jgi:hypothetical protein